MPAWGTQSGRQAGRQVGKRRAIKIASYFSTVETAIVGTTCSYLLVWYPSRTRQQTLQGPMHREADRAAHAHGKGITTTAAGQLLDKQGN